MSSTSTIRTRLSRVGQVLGVALATAGLVLLLEAAQRSGFGEALTWAGREPKAFVLNWALFGALAALVVGLVGRPTVALVCLAAPLGLVTLVHRTKMQLLGKPLFPWDFLLHREALDLMPEVWRYAGPMVLVGVVGVLGALVGLATRVRLRSPRLWVRAVMVVGASALLAVALPNLKTKLKAVGLSHRTWDQADNVRTNGLLLAFAINLQAVTVQRPLSYGASAVRAAAEGLTRREPTGGETPTVIVVMSESFFDVTRLPGLTFSEDPLPTLHQLERDASSGALVPPVFGGGTANTEFEVLTSHAMRFLPVGSVPYQQYVRRPHSSLATIFAAQGYRTAAVHTYHRWFWERDTVYRHFGFERFVSLEDLSDHPLDGKYVSDSVLTREIIRQFESSSDPLFLFAVSMEAHGPYEAGRYPASSLQVEGPLDASAKASLLSYAEAARHADRELGALVDYFSKSGRPAYVVFFGDHLPLLTDVLKQTGVIDSVLAIDSAALPTREFLHHVPLVVWTNTGKVPKSLGAFSTAFLGPALLEWTDTPGTPYSDFVGSLRHEVPVVIPGLVRDGSGALREELPPAVEQRWWTLEYDALFGEDFLTGAGG